ncbi:MAG: hypothetical protein JXB29_09215 [Sedimentisphaerales bacterium]|nr:hypothetical protein [Sedimentisphaerales bacterium]
MAEKKSNFFEEHIEKLVLAAVGLVCIWLLFTRVVINPNRVSYQGQTFNSGEIDIYLNKKTELLAEMLDRKAEVREPYRPRANDFLARIDSAIDDDNINSDVYVPVPWNLRQEVVVKGKYHIPKIGEVNEVSVEHIRTVAYVPTTVVTEEDGYTQENSGPNDIDLVTVESKFNVAGLYERFYESFCGSRVPQEARDPCLAIPVFAAVELERQQKNDDGLWGNWQAIPRTKIDKNKRMFEVIEDVGRLPVGGIKVRLLQFGDPKVKMDLLQPEAYQIASAEQEWFPPSLHKEFTKLQAEIAAEERRQAREDKMNKKEHQRQDKYTARRTRTPKTSTRSSKGGAGGLGEGVDDSAAIEQSMGKSTGRAPSGRRRTKDYKEGKQSSKDRGTASDKTSIRDIYSGLDEILITDETKLRTMDEPLVLWAYDDTVEAGKEYRYRIRLGVFNPIAGTEQFSKEDTLLKDKVILWSEFSDVTEPVLIPAKLYFFPRTIQQAAETVTVTVSRYVLGYWYSKDFVVSPGENIGNSCEYQASEEEQEKGVTVPASVEYSTGALFVDAQGPVKDWAGGHSLRDRLYFDMLYSYDMAEIHHVPIKARYWDDELQVNFYEIRKLEKAAKEPLREWGSKAAERERERATPTEEQGPIEDFMIRDDFGDMQF